MVFNLNSLQEGMFIENKHTNHNRYINSYSGWSTTIGNSWDLFQYKDCLSIYRDSNYKNKMVVRLCHPYNDNSYIGKTAKLYWNSPILTLGKKSAMII